MQYEYYGSRGSASITRRFDAMPERLFDAWIEPVKVEDAAFRAVADAKAMRLDEFFAEHDESKRIFEVLHEMIVALGPAEIHVTKSQVAFRRRRTFAWAWMPGMYLRGKPVPLVLTLALRRRDPSPRWKEIVEPTPGRFMHHMELRSSTDIDDEFRAWLQEAWADAG